MSEAVRLTRLPNGPEKLLHLRIDMGRELAQVCFLSIVAGDGVASLIDHHIDQRHLWTP